MHAQDGYGTCPVCLSVFQTANNMATDVVYEDVLPNSNAEDGVPSIVTDKNVAYGTTADVSSSFHMDTNAAYAVWRQ